jgi:ubiquinone biosynthesis protein COQ9
MTQMDIQVDTVLLRGLGIPPGQAQRLRGPLENALARRMGKAAVQWRGAELPQLNALVTASLAGLPDLEAAERLADAIWASLQTHLEASN